MKFSTAQRHPMGNPRGVILFFGLFVLLILSWKIIYLVTDWFWFLETGYESLFVKTLATQIIMALIFGIGFFFFFWGNLYLALRLSSLPVNTGIQGGFPLPFGIAPDRPLKEPILAASLIFSFFAALQGATHWEAYLRFVHASPFGTTDPLFGKDIGFYVFQFPFLKALYGWLLSSSIVVTAGTGMIYLLRRSFLFIPPRRLFVSPSAKTHLLVLVTALFFLGAFGFWLELNEVLFAKRGVVFGPGYTEVTTQIWVLKTLVGLAAVCGAALAAFIFGLNWRFPAVAVLLLLTVMIVGRGIYPNFVQKFKVVPNEIVLEKPYLERNIKYTRLAYKLNDIDDREFPAEATLTRRDLERNQLTVKNIRLWDHVPLLSTYSQLQEIRTYYRFMDVDNDRYLVNGEYRQVMLSPRELSYPSLPSRTWVNEHLIYTHGYGIVMGPVNRISPEGLPEFFIKDIPPASTADIGVSRPEIYFGEASNEYVFVRTKRPEFDYPVGEKNVYTRYEGKGGVPLSFLRKLLFAARFGALTIMLSDDIVAESRVMYYRDIRDRVGRIAPFMRLDGDPYLVLSPEGRLLWFLDGYTTTARFPYSEPTAGIGNYIRNSMKAVVDAYDGSVDLYISDPDDPILRTYARIFPGIFKPLAEMPEDIRGHIRYPPGMLAIQARMYRAYHMQDPQVFYNKEDLWSIPGKATGHGSEQEMEPYYTVMKIPGEAKEEFILLLPFTPRNKDNMSAWMAARCDMPHYGKVIVYNFPKQKLIYGPRQIEARIDQDTEISKQLSLWNQGGSQVIRGSLLAIPIESSILYVESLYLAAEKGRLPELKRVIVAFGNAIAMEDNLDLSLQRIFGGRTARDSAIPLAGAGTDYRGEGQKTDRELALEALSQYRKAQEYLKQGNWEGYGEALRRMDEILQSVEKRR
ncbi:MAG: UPF0182 family protein [Deltaproteobacteria bacterium]|nr:UPF0182 family protein [Deltaproteobacteria bacterium]